ncbi:MAG: ankyrin repeat domain-containing protein [Armatimonadetes bacterium]|nr:ankyrin repeat domain-containing protein [Armatimonadota bacterium]
MKRGAFPFLLGAVVALVVLCVVGGIGLVAWSLIENDKQERMWGYAQKGDLGGVKRMLAEGAPVDSHWEDESTALMVASENDHYDVVVFLLEHGADPTIEANNPWLKTAVGAAKSERVRRVLEEAIRNRKQGR